MCASWPSDLRVITIIGHLKVMPGDIERPRKIRLKIPSSIWFSSEKVSLHRIKVSMKTNISVFFNIRVPRGKKVTLRPYEKPSVNVSPVNYLNQ